MNCYHIFRRDFSRTAQLLTAAVMLMCCSSPLAADMKRVPPDEAMKAVTSMIKPEYNIIAKQLKLAGSVHLDVVIAEDGTVEDVTVVSGNPVLAKLATDAMKRWRFTPFKSDGKAIKVVSEIAIKFASPE
jgi:TonB family protein